VRKEAGQVVARELDLPSEQRCGRLASALVMDADRMIFGESGESEQILRAEVQDATVAKVEKLRVPGLLRICSTSSRIDLIGESPLTRETYGLNSSSDSIVKSLHLVRHLGIDRRKIAWEPMRPTSKV